MPEPIDPMLADLQWKDGLSSSPRAALPDVSFRGFPITLIAVDELSPEKGRTSRWDVQWSGVVIVDRPMVYLEGFEPGPEETTKEYLARLLATPEAVRWPMRPFRSYRRRWWQFWLKPKPPSQIEAEAREFWD